MRQVWKASSILAALALLVVVMGLSTQPIVQAQTSLETDDPVGAPSESYVCSDKAGGCTLYAPTGGAARVATDPGTGAPGNTGDVPGDNLFLIQADEAAAIEVTIHNLDLPRVTQKIATVADDPGTPADEEAASPKVDGPDANPKKIYISAAVDVIIEAVHKSSGLIDARCDIGDPDSDTDGNDRVYEAAECGATTATAATAYQVKAFNGNRIQVSYTPTGGTFASIETVKVDNGRPSLVSNSPTPGLIVKGNTDITFSADITDSISGYTSTNTTAAGSIHTKDDGGAVLTTGTNDVTDEGGVRLVVAGNVVDLARGDFTKIDDGWRVSKTLNSTALQAIATNVPWYFETRDRANNVRRTSGSVSGTVGATSAGGTIVDAKLTGNLVPGTFLGTNVRVSKKVGSNTVTGNAQPVTFSGGVLTVTNELTDPLFGKAPTPTTDASFPDSPTKDNVGKFVYRCPSRAATSFVATADAVETPTDDPTTIDDAAVSATAIGAANTAQIDACDPAPKDKYEILGTNLITIDSVNPTLASGNPVVTGKGYDAVKKTDKAQRNSIKVSFADLGKTGSNAPGSGIDAATVTAAAFSVSGHTVESVRPVGNSVYLTLAEDLGSTERPWVDVAGSQIRDKAGNAVTATRTRAVDNLGPKLSLSLSPESPELSNDKVTITITTDEQLNATPTVYVTEAEEDGTAKVERDDDGEITAAIASPVRQTGSMSYTYTHENSDGGEFSVYVEASDTSEIKSTVGDDDSAADPGSVTFELDKKLNNNAPPQFDVANVKDVANKTGAADNVEQVDPLIVTVDFAKEGKEYDRDSYRTVTLTSAKLSVRLPNGTVENRTLNLTTDVTTPDNVKFTFPLLNPKIGAYTMTVQAKDRAGNTQVGGSADLKASWDVVAAKPVDIKLAPGWNLISLPFQPAAPAINSVIPADHPASIVMTFDNVSQTWLFSRRDAESGLFTGDIAVMTANTAYFVRTENFEPLKLLRPSLTTSTTASIQPPAITVVEGWNLVAVVSITPGEVAIAADDYFGSLRSGTNTGWLKALTFETLSRIWISVTPGDTMTLGVGDTNPCTGKVPDADKVLDGTEPCQVGEYTERDTGDAVAADSTTTPATEADPVGADENDPNKFDDNDRVVIKTPVEVGKGYWLYATKDGVLIP